MIIVVGSTNKTKTIPVRQIFKRYFKNVNVVGVKVVSGVDDQPMDDGQMYRGALNRARKAIKKIKKADFGVGIEGGLEQRKYGWFERSLVVIVDRKGRIGVGSSGGLVLPDKIIKDIKNGMTLEQAIDKEFKTTKIGESIGMFGLMTKGVVTRTSGVSHGVAFALARFLYEKLYD